MFLDGESGAIRVGSVEVDPSTTRDEFSDSAACAHVDVVNPAEGWYSGHAVPQPDELGWVFLRLSFHDQTLVAVFLSTSDQRQLSWGDWSEEREVAAKRRHDQFLDEQFGSRRTFPWGRVESYVEPRLKESMIAIEYGRG